MPVPMTGVTLTMIVSSESDSGGGTGGSRAAAGRDAPSTARSRRPCSVHRSLVMRNILAKCLGASIAHEATGTLLGLLISFPRELEGSGNASARLQRVERTRLVAGAPPHVVLLRRREHSRSPLRQLWSIQRFDRKRVLRATARDPSPFLCAAPGRPFSPI